MASVIELKEKSASCAEEAKAIQEKADEETRQITAEEMDKIDGLVKESEKFERMAATQERLENLQNRLNDPQKRQATTEAATAARIDVVVPFRFGSLRSFKGKDAERDAYQSGKWLQAVVMNDAAARQWCRDHDVELRVQTEGVNSAGGYVVPTAMERAVIDMREQYGVFRREARVIPMTSDNTVIPRRSGGVTAYFVGETSEITASDKSWNQVELTAKKLAALTRISTDLNEDAIIGIADDIANEMAYSFAVKEDQCGIDGDGTSTYGGMVGIRTKLIDGNHAGGVYDGSSSCDNWSEIDAADLIGTMAKLPQYALANAKWYCSQACKAGVFDRLALALGGNNAMTMAAGAAPAYAGYPIVVMQAMPTDDASAALNNKVMLLFGDLRMSTTLGQRRGITVKVSDQLYLAYDQIGIQATERFCIVNHDLGSATVSGPLIGFVGGS